MTTTKFLAELDAFTLAIDTLHDDQLVNIRRLIEKYIARFGIERVDFLKIVDRRDTRRLVPKAELSTKGALFEFDLQKSGEPNGLCATAILEQRSLWIVPKDGVSQNIYDNNTMKKDLIQDVDVATQARGYEHGDSVCTEIIFPVVVSDICVGVANFRTTKYISRTRILEENLKILGRIMAVLIRIHEDSQYRLENTISAVHALDKMLDAKSIIIDERQVYLAHSSNCDRAITNLIEDGLRNLGEYHCRSWEANESGMQVTEKLIADILSSKVFIAYLSERNLSSSTEDDFTDNANVLLEAGVCYGMIISGAKDVDSLILIRERNSPSLPFDIRNFNVLLVQRGSDNQPLHDQFTNFLRGRLKRGLGLG